MPFDLTTEQCAERTAAKSDQRLQSVKALYSNFSKLLDCNYAAGDAISGMQSGRGKNPITEHVTLAVENTIGMLDSYKGIIEQSARLAQTVIHIMSLGYKETIEQSNSTLTREHGVETNESSELKELDEKIAAIGEAALGYARMHDSLLKSAPEDLEYCIPKIKRAISSTSEEMCYPERPEFRAKNVNSLQDAMRYMHEKAANAVFVFNEVKQNHQGTGGRAIYDDPWSHVEVLDIGGGISALANGKKTPLCKEDILSEPLKTIWGEKVCAAKGNIKVFAASDFMNAQIKLGSYHYATVEAVIRKKEFESGGKNYSHNNYIRLRYIERSEAEGKEYRLGYISKAMEDLGFKMQKSENLCVTAEFKGHYPDVTENALRDLFRLFSSCGPGTEYRMHEVAGHIAEKKNMPVDAAANEMIKAAVNYFKAGNNSLGQFLDTLEN